MKKILMVGVILMVIFVMAGSASAWGRGFHGGFGGPRFGVFIGPPAVWGPPAYYRAYPPPYPYYNYDNRVWIPGHWENRQTPYGWERAWVPGYWQYRY